MHHSGLHRPLHHVLKQSAPRTRLRIHCRALSSSTAYGQRPNYLLEQDTFEPRIQPNPYAKNIAILGGGVTGLATAFDIARTVPDAKITIYERSNRLGGWLDSEITDVDGGEVLFEWGPRSLRPDMGGAGRSTINLVSKMARWYTLITDLARRFTTSKCMETSLVS